MFSVEIPKIVFFLSNVLKRHRHKNVNKPLPVCGFLLLFLIWRQSEIKWRTVTGMKGNHFFQCRYQPLQDKGSSQEDEEDEHSNFIDVASF